MPLSPTGWLLLPALVAAGCAGASMSDEPRWTERQAASITTVRGMHVRAVRCRGLGRHEARNDRHAYTRFDCLAGTRAPGERYDTVTVMYVLRPLAKYERPHSAHRLTNVRFIGGPGIP